MHTFRLQKLYYGINVSLILNLLLSVLVLDAKSL